MCGRFTLSTPAAKLIELFQLTEFPRTDPQYNISPTHLVVCIRQCQQQPQATPMRWGLVPSWAKDLKIGSRMINARSETAAEKPSFRRAWSKQRCLIPVDGFYEWEKLNSRTKQPWLIHMPDRIPFAFAGLWETWQPPDSAPDEVVLSCTVLTTAANEDMSPIHDRMPVVIPPEHHRTWLSDQASPGQLQQLTQPLPPGILQRYRVSNLVNKPTATPTDYIAPISPDNAADLQPPSLFDDK